MRPFYQDRLGTNIGKSTQKTVLCRLAGGVLGVQKYVEAEYELAQADAAFEHAQRRGCMKVQLVMPPPATGSKAGVQAAGAAAAGTGAGARMPPADDSESRLVCGVTAAPAAAAGMAASRTRPSRTVGLGAHSAGRCDGVGACGCGGSAVGSIFQLKL